MKLLLQRLQVLAWLEAYGLSWRDVHFGSGSRISSDAGFPRLHGKHSETSQLNPIVGLESILHAVEDCVDRLFGFGLTDSRPLNDLIHKIEFDHWNLRISLVNI